jgi:hypothetical protein
MAVQVVVQVEMLQEQPLVLLVAQQLLIKAVMVEVIQLEQAAVVAAVVLVQLVLELHQQQAATVEMEFRHLLQVQQ